MVKSKEARPRHQEEEVDPEIEINITKYSITCTLLPTKSSQNLLIYHNKITISMDRLITDFFIKIG